MAVAIRFGQTEPMAKPKIRDLPDLSHLARTGAEIVVRAKPGAAQNRLVYDTGEINIAVTTAPEQGKANAAIRAVLAAAMQVAPGDLTLLRGQTARTKTFRYVGVSRS